MRFELVFRRIRWVLMAFDGQRSYLVLLGCYSFDGNRMGSRRCFYCLFVCFFLPTGDVNEFQCQGLDCFQSIFESADHNLQFFPRVKVKKWKIKNHKRSRGEEITGFPVGTGVYRVFLTGFLFFWPWDRKWKRFHLKFDWICTDFERSLLQF